MSARSRTRSKSPVPAPPPGLCSTNVAPRALPISANVVHRRGCLLAGYATACALHLIDAVSGEYDASVLVKRLPEIDFVVIEWARRHQGLIVAAGNPLKIGAIGDLRKRGVRVAARQQGSGSAVLFAKLLADTGLEIDNLKIGGPPVSSETDIAVAVREKQADAGLAIETVAREKGLDFVPLQWERFDLVVRRVEYFEPALQRLFAFARTQAFRDRAVSLGGYDVANTGTVVFNAKR